MSSYVMTARQCYGNPQTLTANQMMQTVNRLSQQLLRVIPGNLMAGSLGATSPEVQILRALESANRKAKLHPSFLKSQSPQLPQRHQTTLLDICVLILACHASRLVGFGA